jgi:energy-coupling factor transport system ATP-binding protein
VIEVTKLSYRYPRQTYDALRAIDWHVDEGEFVLVCGATGTGKTTLLRCLNGLVPHFHGGLFAGRVVVAGLETCRLTTALLSRVVGYVSQDPETQAVFDRVEDELAFGLENLGLDDRAARVRVEEALDLLGIAQLRRRRLTTLSGGERQRVALAAALAARPRILALDEPTSQLDPWAADAFLETIRRLVDDFGLTVVMAEQRLERVLGLCTRIALLGINRELTHWGSPQEVGPHLPWPPPLVRLGLALAWQPLPLTVQQARAHARAQQLVLIPVDNGRERHRQSLGRASVELDRVDVCFGDEWALRDVSVSFHPGTITVLFGRNGAGKTTLLRLIAGVQKPDRGRVVVFGCETRRMDRRELARSVGYVPQHPSSILFEESLRKEVVATLRGRGQATDDCERVLARLGLLGQTERHPYDLSGGERQRAALGAVLVGKPPVVLLDEPTRGLDAGWKSELGRVLRELAEEGITVVVATHDVEFIAAWADRVVLIASGQVVAEGTPAEVLAGTFVYSTQINRVFGSPYLTVEDVLESSRRETGLPQEGGLRRAPESR